MEEGGDAGRGHTCLPWSERLCPKFQRKCLDIRHGRLCACACTCVSKLLSVCPLTPETVVWLSVLLWGKELRG